MTRVTGGCDLGGTPAFAACLRRPGAACGLSCLPPPSAAFEPALSAPGRPPSSSAGLFFPCVMNHSFSAALWFLLSFQASRRPGSPPTPLFSSVLCPMAFQSFKHTSASELMCLKLYYKPAPFASELTLREPVSLLTGPFDGPWESQMQPGQSKSIGLPKKFFWIFPSYLMEKHKRTYWPTQYFLSKSAPSSPKVLPPIAYSVF